jgi:hypothetical protein
MREVSEALKKAALIIRKTIKMRGMIRVNTQAQTFLSLTWLIWSLLEFSDKEFSL